jgi:hypothetical protein
VSPRISTSHYCGVVALLRRAAPGLVCRVLKRVRMRFAYSSREFDVSELSSSFRKKEKKGTDISIRTKSSVSELERVLNRTKGF